MLFLGEGIASLVRHQCGVDLTGRHMAPTSSCGARAGRRGQGVLHGCGGAITRCYCGCGMPRWCRVWASPSGWGARGRGEARAACGGIAVFVIAALALMQEGFRGLLGSCWCDLQQRCVPGLTGLKRGDITMWT